MILLDLRCNRSSMNERTMKEEGLLREFVASLIDERTFANGLFDTYFYSGANDERREMLRIVSICSDLKKKEEEEREISLDHSDGKWCRNCEKEKEHSVLSKHMIIMHNKKGTARSDDA